eukprot:gnl/TRDRNA2_/TRDRNA2_173830_c0_seq2.p2 gnl/TRDRNA2_/TRDRNA2_173830_c0~~gnl/TRDRNA2_/TRDRNA2_173830_c0_seq2.p2  ORF type:complete len:156 (+),score=16.45 gnl/TRDRNA2_/TRDRNA2_173830_c0_seq2:122-589(+)
MRCFRWSTRRSPPAHAADDEIGAASQKLRRMVEMCHRDLRIMHEHSCPVGYHEFRCQIIVFVALAAYDMDSLIRRADPGEVDEDALKAHERRARVTASRPSSSADFDLDTWPRWGAWTSKGARVVELACDHTDTKKIPEALDIITAALTEVRTRL